MVTVALLGDSTVYAALALNVTTTVSSLPPAASVDRRYGDHCDVDPADRHAGAQTCVIAPRGRRAAGGEIHHQRRSGRSAPVTVYCPVVGPASVAVASVALIDTERPQRRCSRSCWSPSRRRGHHYVDCPAVLAGVTQVTCVALTTTTDVAAVPPKLTLLVPAR